MPRLGHLVVVQDGLIGATGSLERLCGLLQLELGPTATVMRSCSSHPWGGFPSFLGTLDGIPAGGNRLADEIERSIHGLVNLHSSHGSGQERASTHSLTDYVCLSLVGMSLGGLFCRYAAGELQRRSDSIASQGVCRPGRGFIWIGHRTGFGVPPSSGGSLAPPIKASLLNFVSLASPHLGVRGCIAGLTGYLAQTLGLGGPTV